MSGLLSNIFKLAGRTLNQQINGLRQFHALPSSISNSPATPSTKPWSLEQVRTIIRNNFPKAKENKRVKTHGWKVKLSTKNGRRQIMRRILKGRWYLTH